MRESLYFKDDDERLSFLFGNYITMTNMEDHEIDRIIKMHISPINISWCTPRTPSPGPDAGQQAGRRDLLKYLPCLVEGALLSTVSWCCAAGSTMETSCAAPCRICWS